MRHLERSILLQVIDNRWREHLFDMDYLREGIHLRGFAQIDPLVAYKNEGFTMFEELMHSIWDEFSKLIFHAEIEYDPSQPETRSAATAAPNRSALGYSGGTSRSAALGAAAGRRERRRRSGRRRRRAGGRGGGATWSRPWSKTSTTKSAATTPAGAAPARSTRSATGHSTTRSGVHPGLQRARPRRLRRGARSRGRAALRARAAQGGRGGAAVGDAGAGWRPADDRAGAALRGRDRGRGRACRGPDRAALALGRETARPPARTRWPGSSSCTTAGSAAGGRSRTADAALRAGGFEHGIGAG